MHLFPTTLITADPNLNNGRLEVLFIDPGVAGWESLVQGARPGVEVVLLDAHQDGLAQMALWAGSRQDVAAVHVLSHGAAAQLNLGSLKLTTQALNDRSADLATLGAALTAEGDVLLYGCNVASGDEGAQFVALLADLTGADISASEDATGSALFGGDWLLEAQVGSLESVGPFDSLAQAAYSGLLGVNDLDFDDVGYLTGTASSVDIAGWRFTVPEGSTQYDTFAGDQEILYLSSTSADRVFVWDSYRQNGRNEFILKSADGSNFNLTSFSLGSIGATSLDVVAYCDGQAVYIWSVDLRTSSFGPIVYDLIGADSNGAYGSMTLGPAFDNVDEIHLNFQGDASVEIDDIVATPVPAIHNASYDASTGQLTVYGTDFVAAVGSSNDILARKFTLTGEGWTTYTLFDTSNVEIDNANSFTLTLSASDKAAINQILNKNGTSSTGSTTYNLAAAEGWAMGFNAGTSTLDNTGNGIIVSNVMVPSITSATYDALTGILNVSGNGFSKSAGASNDIDASKFIFIGEGGDTYTLTSTNSVEISSGTNFVLSLSANDRASVNTILNKNGNSSTSGSTYNLAAAQNWAAGASSVPNTDLTGNGITLSNVAAPTITSANYDGSTGVLVVTGTGFLKRAGESNDIDASKFTLTGESGVTYTLTDTSPAEITSGTSFTLTLSPTDKATVNQLLNSDGTSSRGGTTYNLLAAEDWATGANAPVNVADFSGNGITVSNAPPPPSTTVVTAQLSNDTGSSSSDFITSEAVQTVFGTLSANLLAGESVWVSFDNGASWGTAMFAGSSWSTSTTLVGTDTLKVRVESSAGAGATYAQTYTVDTAQPSAPSAPDLASGSDTGVSASDDITYDNTPTLDGTAENGSTVVVYDTDGTTLLGSTTAAGGNWSITTSALDVGMHTFWAKATDRAGNVSSASSGLSILIENSAPTVLFVAVPANGLFGAGTTLDFTVNFSETVTVNTTDGTPVLTLNLDTGGPVTASYVSGSGSSALVFRYTIANGHVDTNGVTLGLLHANGGSVMDNAGNLANLTLNNVASTNQIEVDGVAPAVMGVSVPAHASYKAANNLDFTVHFNEDISVDTGNGTPVLGLVVGASLVYATYISGSGSNSLVFRHTIIAGMNDNNGITIGSLSLSGGTLRDAAGNHATLTLNNLGSTAGVRVDTTAPTVTHVSVPVNDTYKVGDNLDFTVNFDEVVMVTTSGGVPEIALTLGAATVHATYIAGSGSSALTFRYTVSAGNIDTDGISVGALDLKGGALRDAAGHDALLTLNNVASTAAVRVDNPISAPVFDSNLTNVVSVYQGKGYTMETIISPRPGGGTNTTQSIAPVAVQVVDIPLGGSVQAPTLLAQLPVGVGLKSFGSTNLSQGMTNPELWVMQDLQQFIMGQPLLRPAETLQPQAADFLQGLPPNDEMSFRVISLTADGSNPSPIVVDIRPPDPVLSAGHAVGLVIDTQALGLTPATVHLNNIDFAAIVGSAIVMGGSGSNWVVGDSSSQLIFLGLDDDVLHGGGGDDTVASTTGRDRLFGAAGHDLVVGGRDSDVLDGGDGHDVIQGGDSDAGTWSFSIVKGELISQFVHANALLTPQDSLRHVGPWWSDASQTQHLDDRLAFSLETPERLQLVSTLYDIVTGGLPDLNALNFYSTSSKSDSQLAQLAADEMLAAVKGLPLEAQARSVIEKAWGAGQASEALLPEALAYLANGGSWGDGLLELVRSPVAAARFSDGLGFALSQNLVSSELGWSKNSGHDFLHGGAGQDRLVGGDGNDVIYGGPGTDLAAWMGQLNDYTIQLSHLSTDKGVLLRHVATGEEDFLADVELIQIGARYFRLPDTSTSDLSLSLAMPLGEFAQEVSWQEVQLVGAHLLGHVV